MQTKTYFASSVQGAMEVARRELGPEAMLVTSRPAPEDVRVFGRLEVTFAWEPDEAMAERPAELGKPIARAESSRGRGGAELEDIRQEMSALRAAFGRQVTGGGPAQQAMPSAEDEACEKLCETGFEKDMARQLAGAGDIGRQLETRISVAGFAPMRREESRALAFVGPAGRGKTSSLVKIAVRYGLANRIPTRIYSAGSHGVGGAEQMARYAAILGVPFQSLETFEGLHLALHGDRWKGLVLIDTPGAATNDRQEMDAMASFFSRHPEIERHLVLRAEARSADMGFMQKKFAAIQPTRLLFTGLDEVRGLGAAAETMIRSGIAATFFGTGPRIPEDIEEVNAVKLSRSLWSANRMAARAAA